MNKKKDNNTGVMKNCVRRHVLCYTGKIVNEGPLCDPAPCFATCLVPILLYKTFK